MPAPFRLRADGVDLIVRLTPKSAIDAVEGIAVGSDGAPHLKARVRAVPDKGAANAALEALIAAWLGTPRRNVALIAGGTSRLKTIRISGDPALIAAVIEARTNNLS